MFLWGDLENQTRLKKISLGEAGCGNWQFANILYVLTSPYLPPQDGFPIRIKAVHIVNEPRIFKGIFAIIKPFLKEKIANRVSDDPTKDTFCFCFLIGDIYKFNCDISNLILVYYSCPGTINLESSVNSPFCEGETNKNITFDNRESKARIVISELPCSVINQMFSYPGLSIVNQHYILHVRGHGKGSSLGRWWRRVMEISHYSSLGFKILFKPSHLPNLLSCCIKCVE